MNELSAAGDLLTTVDGAVACDLARQLGHILDEAAIGKHRFDQTGGEAPISRPQFRGK